MPKRRAADDLEDIESVTSPSSKRARFSEEAPDILGADRAEHEELLETGTVDIIEGEREEGEEDEYDDDEEEAIPTTSRQKAPIEGHQDIYLDTINRKALDFDFEKLCSVTLSNINVYACLVCGKYYQGRGPKSQAYFHALDEDHHVYINLETKKIYVLPEGYEVQSNSLDDIKFVLDPRLPKSAVLALDRPLPSGETPETFDLEGKKYVPGYVGMNNIKANDYFNVIIQALSHVSPLRNFLILQDMDGKSQLAQRFGSLVRKIWNPRAFKAHVSPHELLQEISLKSSKRFNLTEQSDPVEFAQWFLNALHTSLGGSKSKPSIVSSVFRGKVAIESQNITAHAGTDRLHFTDAPTQSTISPFMILTLDLPPAPLFQDASERNIIPQVALTTLLAKYNGITTSEAASTKRRYRLQHPLPPYLLLHIKRFTTNKFLPSERNPTIVTFSPTALNLSPFVAPSPSHPSSEPILYDLVANVTHEAVRVRDDSVEGEAEKKEWMIQLLDRRTGTWWERADLWGREVSGETVFARESYLMVWERRRTPAKRNGLMGKVDKGKGRA
jgi:U4/U6.U5 tri-snRNP-associated protein 2